jgi:hypothetical protein
MAGVIETRNPDPVLQSLETRNAEIHRQTELLKARNDISKRARAGRMRIRFICAVFGGAVAAVLFENLARIVLARHAWWEPLALFLAAFVALCIALFAYRGACYCLISYWTVLNKWEEFQMARTSALLARAKR